MNKKIQLIEKKVEKPEQIVRISEDLDKDFDYLTGIAVLDNIGLNSRLLSSSLDGSELFPKNFEVRYLQSNLSVPPDYRLLTLFGREAKGRKVEFEYQDGGTAKSYPYTLFIYLRLEDEPR